MKKIAVLGLGKVGALVADLLSKDFEIIAIDNKVSNFGKDTSNVRYECIDVLDIRELDELLKRVDAVVSCLAYHLNKSIASRCIEQRIHYFDLTEDIDTTNYIRKLAKNTTSVAIPQCGLAPGFIGIVGFDLIKKFTKLRAVELRVGALPQYPNGLLGYSFTWSPMGVINEYINDAEVIHNGTRKMVPSLDAIENMQLEGLEFEAFTTSGGLGTLCETLEGKVDTLNYKTIRYPGHAKIMKLFLYELLMKDDIETLEYILTKAKPIIKKDIVYVYAVVEGEQKGEIIREEYYNSYKPKRINGREWRAISWTTAASLVSIIYLVATKKIEIKGFVKQEDIPFDLFLSTPTGKLFIS